MTSLVRLLHDARPATLAVAAGSLIALVALTGTQSLIRPSLAEYRTLRETRINTAELVREEEAGSLPDAVAELEARLETLRDELYGGPASVPLREVESHVIGSLERISVGRGVELQGVRPREPSSVLMFDELPYEVEVEGDYLELFRWLRDAESELRPMVVKSFEMRKGAEDGGVILKLRLVAYRAPEGAR